MRRTLCAVVVVLLSIGNARGQEQSGLVAADTQTLVAAQEGFGLSLLSKLGADSAFARGVAISPYSVHAALSLVRLGATSQTAQELDFLLYPRGFSAGMQRAYRSLNEAVFMKDEGLSASIANSIWVAKDAPLRDPYRLSAQRYFGALVKSVDFSAASTHEEVNKWVAGVTENLIPRLLGGPFDPSTVAALVNGLYLKAAWAETFDLKATRPGDFWTEGSGVIKHPMMHRTVTERYAEDEEWKIASFPSLESRYLVTIFLPRRQKQGVSALAARLTPGLISRARVNDQRAKLNVALPKFEIRSRPSLKGILSAALPRTFSRDAQLGEISKSPLWISDVVHESVIKVNEDGVEAAAASAVVMVGSAYRPAEEEPKIVDFIVDRPFGFVITHGDSGAPLFVGVIGDPRGS